MENGLVQDDVEKKENKNQINITKIYDIFSLTGKSILFFIVLFLFFSILNSEPITFLWLYSMIVVGLVAALLILFSRKINSRLGNKIWFSNISFCIGVIYVWIVVGIISLMTCRLCGSQGRARDTARRANLNEATAGILKFYKDNGYYPTGNCLNEIEELLVPFYLNSTPEDPQTKRVVYGTKPEGCPPGQYGYKNIKRNGESNSGFVLIASMESEGRNANFVIGGEGVVNFVSDCDGDSNCYSKENPVGTGEVANIEFYNDSFDEALEIEKLVCNSVTLTGGDTASISDPDNCQSPSKDSIVYVIVK